MRVVATIRYELFHTHTDTTHTDDWVALTTMIHDGKDFVAYETSYYHKNKMSAEDWGGLMARIETAATSSLCNVTHSGNLLDIYECTTYTVNVYGEG